MTKFKVGDKVRYIEGPLKGGKRVIAEWAQDWERSEDWYQFTNGSYGLGRNLELVEPATPKFNVGDKVRFIKGPYKGLEFEIAEWTKDFPQPKDAYQFNDGYWVEGEHLELIEPATPKFNVGDTVKETIANNAKRYYVQLAYVELGNQNGIMKQGCYFAHTPAEALAKAIKAYGTHQLNMPLQGYDVFHCKRKLTTG